MAKFVADAMFDLPLERKLEVKEIAMRMHTIVNKYFLLKRNFNVETTFKLDKAYILYKNEGGEHLTTAEQSLFYLYILFPDDEAFTELLECNENDYNKIAKLQCLNPAIIRLRYYIQKNMTAEKEAQAKLQKQ